MKNIKKLEQKFIEKLRQYQDVKSKPVLSKKYFSELMKTFIESYRRMGITKNKGIKYNQNDTLF